MAIKQALHGLSMGVHSSVVKPSVWLSLHIMEQNVLNRHELLYVLIFDMTITLFLQKFLQSTRPHKPTKCPQY